MGLIISYLDQIIIYKYTNFVNKVDYVTFNYCDITKYIEESQDLYDRHIEEKLDLIKNYSSDLSCDIDISENILDVTRKIALYSNKLLNLNGNIIWGFNEIKNGGVIIILLTDVKIKIKIKKRVKIKLINRITQRAVTFNVI